MASDCLGLNAQTEMSEFCLICAATCPWCNNHNNTTTTTTPPQESPVLHGQSEARVVAEQPPWAIGSPVACLCTSSGRGMPHATTDLLSAQDTLLNLVKVDCAGGNRDPQGLHPGGEEVNPAVSQHWGRQHSMDYAAAVGVAIDKLNHVTEMAEAEVQGMGHWKEGIRDCSKSTIGHPQPVLARLHKALRHSHIFYKINFVLAGGEPRARV